MISKKISCVNYPLFSTRFIKNAALKINPAPKASFPEGNSAKINMAISMVNGASNWKILLA